MRNFLNLLILLITSISFSQENDMQIRLPDNVTYDYIGTADGKDENERIELYECLADGKSFGYLRVNREDYPVCLLKAFNEYGGGDLYVFNSQNNAYEKKGQMRKHNEKYAVYYLNTNGDWKLNHKRNADNIFDALTAAYFLYFTNLSPN